MSQRNLPGKSFTTQDYKRWSNSKLDRRNVCRVVRLLKDQERLISPTRISLRTTKSYGRIHYEKQEERKRENDTKANQERSFMKLNLDSPSPTAYNPASNPPNMTNPPAYTMRPKTYPEKDGGDRVAWGKEWFTNCNRWSLRANFNSEHKWPSPTDHVPKPTIGCPQITLHQSPSHSIAKRREFILVGKDARSFPGPCSYDRSQSQNNILANSPNYSIQEGRRKGTLPFITQQGSSPGPGSYNPNIYQTSLKVRRPAFTISKSPRIIGITRNCSF